MLRGQTRCRTLSVVIASLILCAASAAVVPCLALAADDWQRIADDELEGGEPASTESAPYRYAIVRGGYRFVSPDAANAGAMPYSRLNSGFTGGVAAGTIGSDLKLAVDATVLNEDDYHAELSLDYAGVYRLHLESQALWHNLIAEQLPASSTGTFISKDLAPGAGYGVRSAMTQVDGRVRLGHSPYHLSLGYWELIRSGTDQLRFSDHYFLNPASSINSTSRAIDSITREGTIALDGQFKYWGLAYGFRFRDFSDEALVDRYNYHVSPNGGLLVTAGPQAHDVTSGSQVLAHTIKLYTDLSGGLVASAAYTLTQRENNADRGDARPVSRPADTLQSVAGDLSYTPAKELSFALKYRRLQFDRESPSAISYQYSQIPTSGVIPGVYTTIPGMLLVRPSSDTVRDSLILSGSYHPTSKSNLRLEYRAEFESRDNIPDSPDPGNPTALHRDSRQTHTGKASFYWRPYIGLKLNATYSYTVSDKPAYSDSFSERHSGQLFITYTPVTGKWGTAVSYLSRRESGENAGTTAAAPILRLRLPRESRSDSANASFWFSPLKGLTVTSSYSFIQNDIDQAMLFADFSVGSLTGTNYLSTAHVYGLDTVYAFSEVLDLSLGLQQVRSLSRFSIPVSMFNDPVAGTLYSTAGITDLTRLNSIETSISSRADWRINPVLGCSLDYAYRLFHSNKSLYDGSVHTTMVMIKARW